MSNSIVRVFPRRCLRNVRICHRRQGSVCVAHVLKIDGYSRTAGLAVGKFITSRSFEVGGGHRWCLRYYPDGYSSNYAGCISILLFLDPGETGEVRALFKISLLDQEGRPVAS
ncbi:hypothetical protein ACQ4PT_055002 [Festuca glaucescens]